MKVFRRSLLTGFLVFSCLQSIAGGFNNEFPDRPDQQMTPGSLCKRPKAYRYPEKIAYCERDVDPSLKKDIIVKYNQSLGYRIFNRGDFKIDHYIPLCMGGSNDRTNLWPQHWSIYNQTDPLEGLLCEKMRDGRLRQKAAIDLIRQAKNDLALVRQILKYAQAL